MKYHICKISSVLDKCFYIIGWVCIGIAGIVFLSAKFGLFQKLGGFPPCMFHRLTGYYCPGCGGTRAVIALFRGKILTSLYFHPIVVYTAVLGGWFMLSQTIERLSNGKLQIGLHYRDLYLWIALAIIILNCLIKNLLLRFTGFVWMA